MTAKWLGFFSVLCLVGISSAIAFAEPAPLELTMDQTQLIPLDKSAASVIVANPEHISVTLDNPRLLILTPHAAGATSLIVLDAAGKTILEQEVIVTNVQKKYVRIKRMCTGNDASCAAQSYDYCPDGCYAVTEIPANSGATGTPPPTSAPGTIQGEPAETLIGPLDDCPPGYDKSAVPGVHGDQHYTCAKR